MKYKNGRKTSMDEIALVQAAQEGNMNAFETLMKNNRQRIFALAYQYTKNPEDTEDIFQDTFLKAYNNIQKFRAGQDTSFSAWLYRIGINCSIDHLRKHKRRRETTANGQDVQTLPTSDSGTDPEKQQQKTEIQEKTEAVLKTIAPRQRMVFILRHYQQLSIKEIAEYLDCSEGSVKKQLFRAISTFKEQFKSFIPEASYEV
jgi:RNA polymerase sigma-70 factor (ECF subfamily)